MSVMCPATWQRRKANGCDAKCSHFLPHPLTHSRIESKSCKAITSSEGYVICPACIEATPKRVEKAMVKAMVYKMTKEFEYEEEEK
jgi:hypothetical protein